MDIGFKALQGQYGIQLAQALRVESSIGKTRSKVAANGLTCHVYPASYTPENNFAGHFAFGLKYEELHLEFFKRLFDAAPPSLIEAWIRSEPFGQYARKTGFLYEWLTGRQLDVPDMSSGSYLDLLPPGNYLVRSTPERNSRWRIRNNLPGTPAFCPLVRRTPELQQALAFDVSAALQELDSEFGPDVLLRTASWLTFKESRASFLIEKEADQTDRIARFAHVIAQHSGRISDPLGPEGLQTLQQGILGDRALRLGLRQSPVFVGQSTLREDVVHYIAPGFDDVPSMLTGLQALEQYTRGQEAVVRAAVLACGFVYIHPMADGNGRIHRFLINDVLQRDGAIPEGVILPVSATITNSREFAHGYDEALDVFSRPFMQRYAGHYAFGPLTRYADGITSNFEFDAYADALAAWRYPDLTHQVLYTAQVIAHTIRHEMADEARVLLTFQRAQQRIKEVMEMPDAESARLIRSIKENGWKVSGKLRQEYPQLEDQALSLRLIEAVRSAFENREPLPIIE